MIDFNEYTRLENEWYNKKQPLVEAEKYKEAISITEHYLEQLSGDYGQEWSGKLGGQLLISLINISHKMKDYDYALQKCVELSKIDFNKISGHDGGKAEFYLGATYYELGDMEKAKEYLLIAKKKSGGRCMELLGTDKYKQFLKSVEPSKEQVKQEKALAKLSKLIKDDDAVEDIDLFLKNMVKSGFFSLEDMAVGLKNFVECNYEEHLSKIKPKNIQTLLSLYTETFTYKKDPVNFRKFDSVFDELRRKGLITLHAMGNTDDEGLEECKDEATRRIKAKENVTGYCFYTLQALFNMFEYDSGQLLLSYGSFNETSTDKEIGNFICRKLEEAGFEVIWDGEEKTKIAICIEWDKQYTNN
ncbi:DUF6891 domain-containing protein [Parabacteroides distasonis]|uniref:DUF6891 domain-containing protein n=1 Tax=Parabacteroides distasonis TaxID=823 RepID=UPI001F2BD5E8|nr:hypothetical protein [Parabacteroides distasonis]MCE9042867.1 hypothetical protein [Parabacteroides distasonis]